MPRMRSFLGLAFLLCTAACGSDNPAGPGSNAPGTFQMTVTGALTASFSGTATFTSLANDVFGLSMVATSSTGQQYVQVNRENGGRPGTGTYTITDGTGGGQFIAIGLVQGVGVTSRTGTMTITSSSPSEIQGDVSFEGNVTGGNGTVTVTVSFRASCPISSGCT